MTAPILDLEPAASSGRRRLRRLVPTVALVVAVAAGAIVLRDRGDAAAGYRTAVAATHSVEQIWRGVASVEPVSQAVVAFPTAGTVSSVAVVPGASVAVGATLATLDTTELLQALHEQQAELAEAELTVRRGLDGEDIGSSSAGPGGAGTAGSAASAPATTTTVAGAATGAASNAARERVDAASRELAEAERTASSALDAALACASPGASTTTTTTTTSTTTSSTTTTTAAPGASGCGDLLAAVGTSQRQLTAAAGELSDAAAALISDASAASAGSPGGAGTSGQATAGATATAATSTGASTADLLAAQRAVDASTLGVAVALQALAQTTIVSPIEGTVVAVELVAGEEVDAASSTAHVTVVGEGGMEATATVATGDIGQLAVGQPTDLLVDGRDDTVRGTVVSVTPVPTTSSSGTSAYRITVGFATGGDDLPKGATGELRIRTASTSSSLAVPTSAVVASGSGHVVTVLRGTATTRVRVEVGVVGSEWTAITSGLEAGDRVVLADLSEPLPGSATESSGSDTGGGAPSGAPGGGVPGGGFPGGAPPGAGGGR